MEDKITVNNIKVVNGESIKVNDSILEDINKLVGQEILVSGCELTRHRYKLQNLYYGSVLEVSEVYTAEVYDVDNTKTKKKVLNLKGKVKDIEDSIYSEYKNKIEEDKKIMGVIKNKEIQDDYYSSVDVTRLIATDYENLKIGYTEMIVDISNRIINKKKEELKFFKSKIDNEFIDKTRINPYLLGLLDID